MKAIDKSILHLAVPSVVSNVTVPLIGLVDIAITGHLGGAALIGAISVGSMTFNIIYWLFGFLRMGSSGLVAQAVGRNDHLEAMAVAWRVLSLGVLIGLIFILFRSPLFILSTLAFDTPSDSLGSATIYFNICIFGAPAVLCLYGLTGWFIGMQDTRTPMTVAIVQNIVNLAVGITLAVVLGMGIRGIALGTLIAQWTGFLFSLLAMIRKSKYSGLQIILPSHIIYRWQEIKKFFHVNANIFLRTVCLVAVNLYFTAAGSRQGTVVLAANTVLLTFYTIFSYFMDGFAYAGEALCGRLFGMGAYKELKQMTLRLMLWGLVMAGIFTVSYLLGGNLFLRLLTDDVSVVACANSYGLWAVLIPITGMAAFILDGIFVGLTASTGMLLAAALAAGSFFVLSPLLIPHIGNNGLWLAFNVYLAMRGIVEYIWLRKKKLISSKYSD